ncbi:GNAT family N-acetyltransferase [Devosia sp. BK]|uniref:GNAT family N-acetyltransferase n=1 Tax=Devosia sp. BK TaxID=2871706 RepID=UPI00293B13B7|nr:GNAT family N-acetyltransferase [Devosia sp. BK]MDV3253798.1 GNAT family N-acetyltransferase [Devosia sp. BK]
MVEVTRYDSSFEEAWDELVEDSKAPLFFLKRKFVEYHKDRFTDHSLLFFEGGKLIATLPATQKGDSVTSHGGLTFGGLVLRRSLRSALTRDIFDAMASSLRASGIGTLTYKAVPHIFHEIPAEEDLYFLVQDYGAKLARRDLSSIIDTSKRLPFSKGRKALISKARKSGISISRSQDWAGFHQLLSSVLSRHDAAPVHTPAELELLATMFPDNVKLYTASMKAELMAGCLIFDFGQVVHTQYLATSDSGKDVGALDLLIETQIKEAADRKYFSFGISTEQAGKVLNDGLLAQKESFGARSVSIDSYRIDF